MGVMPELAHEVVVNGERVRYYRSGAGPAVVLLHGLGGAGLVWHRTMPALIGRYDVIAPDLWGLVRYEGEVLTIEMGVGFVAGLLDAMEVSDAHLVGSSLGGLIAGHLALRRPDRVRSLTLVASAGLGRHIAWSQRLMTLPGVGELFFRPTRGRVQRMLRLLVRVGQIDPELADALYEDSRTGGGAAPDAGGAARGRDAAWREGERAAPACAGLGRQADAGNVGQRRPAVSGSAGPRRCGRAGCDVGGVRGRGALALPGDVRGL